MGLDSFMFTADVVKENGIIVIVLKKVEVGYWRRCWFIHEYLTSIYLDTVDHKDSDFNGITMELDLPILLGLHEAMCYEAYMQNLSFDEVEIYDEIDSSKINELKKVIKFVKDNPTETVYYAGRY